MGTDILKDQSRQEVIRDFTEFVQLIANNIGNEQKYKIKETAKKIVKNSNIMYYLIQDKENNIISSKIIDKQTEFILSKKNLKISIEKAIKKKGFAMNYFYSLDNRPVTEMIQEIRWNGEYLGIVRLGIDESKLKKSISSFKKTALNRNLYSFL